MVIYEIAVGGAHLPACLQQSTEIFDGNHRVGHDTVPLRTYPSASGAVTSEHYVVVSASGAATLTVRVTIGSHSATRETGAYAAPDLSGAVPVDMAGDTQHD
jgi:hypothetical protein